MTAEKRSKAKPVDRAKGARAPAQPEEAPAATTVAEAHGETGWHEQAAFHVTFDYATGAAGEHVWRTHAYHNETGGETERRGILAHGLIDWMRERAGLEAEAPVDSPSVAIAGTEDTDAGAHATDLRLDAGALEIEELPVEQEVGGPPAYKRMRAQMRFDLSGPAAYLASAELAGYSIQVLACDMTTGEMTVLASGRSQLRPELLNYTEELKFALPTLGSYQLLANVILPDSGVAAIALGPLLEVVE